MGSDSISKNTVADARMLVADIGGTHVRFAQATYSQAQGGQLSALKQLRCADFDSLAAALHAYLGSYTEHGFERACFAVAAPISGDAVRLTNNPWSFSVAQMEADFQLQRLQVINDFEAIAYAVPHLQATQLQQLGGGEADPAGNMAVLGPGTGLGVKHLTATAGGWKVLMGEGGHVDFAPVDEQELLLWRFLKNRFSRASAEELLSGRGLVHIYQALSEAAGQTAQWDRPEIIVEQGLSRQCQLCQQTLQQFLRILGSFAGNLALTLNTTGGVYLAGGVVTALAGEIGDSDLRRRFEAKGRFQAYVADIPVYIITDPQPGLSGAMQFLLTQP